MHTALAGGGCGGGGHLTLTGSHSNVFSATTSKNCHASLAILLVNDPLQTDSVMVLVG